MKRDKDAILATLAVGVEKLEKLALGIMAIEAGGEWPNMSDGRHGWGHRTAQMDRRLRNALVERVGRGDYSEHIRRLLCTVERDKIWTMIVEALDVYGSEGRFYNLDILSGRTQRRGNPMELWATAENAAVEQSEALRGLLGQVEFGTALSNSLAVSIHRWWTLIALSGMHGVLGCDWGKNFGAEQLPDEALATPINPACS